MLDPEEVPNWIEALEASMRAHRIDCGLPAWTGETLQRMVRGYLSAQAVIMDPVVHRPLARWREENPQATDQEATNLKLQFWAVALATSVLHAVAEEFDRGRAEEPQSAPEPG